jgi:hypothetical protein
MRERQKIQEMLRLIDSRKAAHGAAAGHLEITTIHF